MADNTKEPAAEAGDKSQDKSQDKKMRERVDLLLARAPANSNGSVLLGGQRLEYKTQAVSYTHLDVYKRQVPHPPTFHIATWNLLRR